jgi:hypothetical protein
MPRIMVIFRGPGPPRLGAKSFGDFNPKATLEVIASAAATARERLAVAVLP